MLLTRLPWAILRSPCKLLNSLHFGRLERKWNFLSLEVGGQPRHSSIQPRYSRDPPVMGSLTISGVS